MTASNKYEAVELARDKLNSLTHPSYDNEIRVPIPKPLEVAVGSLMNEPTKIGVYIVTFKKSVYNNDGIRVEPYWKVIDVE